MKRIELPIHSAICQVCGVEIPGLTARAARSTKYCPDCLVEKQKEWDAQYHDTHTPSRVREIRAAKVAARDTLSARAAAARAAGMSYGQYQGWLAEQARLRKHKK